MMKTIENYMDDPRILSDKGVMEAPLCIREIHAVRLKLQDEYNVFSSEYAVQCHKTTEALFAKYGKTPLYADFPHTL
jgi:hypothetical protein